MSKAKDGFVVQAAMNLNIFFFVLYLFLYEKKTTKHATGGCLPAQRAFVLRLYTAEKNGGLAKRNTFQTYSSGCSMQEQCHHTCAGCRWPEIPNSLSMKLCGN